MPLKQTELHYSLLHTIYSSETDMEQRLRPGALVDLLIQAAIGSADQLGFGVDELQEQACFWVLSQLSVEISRPLKWKEKLRISTWPKDQQGAFYLRDFLVYDAAGEIVIKAVSAWLALDDTTKRPRRIAGQNAAVFTQLKAQHALPYPPEKLGYSPGGASRIIQPSYTDYDLNRHVTASRYIDWLFDSLPTEFLNAHYPTKLSINYLKEILPEQSLQLFQDNQEEHIRFEGRQAASGQVAYRASLHFG